MGWSKQSEADGGGESETQCSTGEGKEAGFISPAVFNCARVLVGDACFFLGNSGEVDRTLGEIY
ncbi:MULTISPECIES: hypothetical protein [unclassified Microcoleus]|uniref:hypothetical protein n=1 Tax=unclassified Microcoleus TaxID=2642155 RepID=UPI002FD3849A